ncbi:aspartic proteinase NANA, chloroplast-like [Argentina anserina]|uniref:aspartic proteinase NANA, chloroplast-like n=1 Tax=Argentina anserina TaxID=57926 RepID=UPI002176700D|nr:aspartic proteinase NANA, chloroplast-like [Potentilla anserina]
MVSSQKFGQMMKGKTPSSFLFIVLLLSIVVINGDGSLFVNSNPSHDEDDSITFDLIHRESPKWPGNEDQPPKSQREIIKERHLRDIKRQQAKEVTYPLRKDGAGIKLKVESGADIELGGYLAEVYIGTPPRKLTLLLDTASDITWLNCKYDCNDCLHARHRDNFYGKHERYYTGEGKKSVRVFQADRSSTFKPVPCSTIQCRALREMGSVGFCPSPSAHCMYNMSYLGGDIAAGFFGEDIVRAPLTTTGRSLKLKHMVIGCTETVVKLNKVDGILALGFSVSSWADKASRNFGPKFSYCLMDFASHMNVTSHITFGPNNKVASHAPMIHTKFFLPNPGHYGVDVTGISVGGKMLDIPEEIWIYSNVTGGGTIIDLGSSNAWLSEPAYEAVMAEYRKVFSKYQKIITDPADIPFELCFKAPNIDYSSVPKLAYHFLDGAVFEPPVKNFVAETTPGNGETCVAIVKSNTYTGTLIGNVMMQNYLWEFDLEEQTVGFTPSKCA